MQNSIHPLIFHLLNLEDKTTAAKVIGLGKKHHLFHSLKRALLMKFRQP
jgi:hypothetical protein